MSAVKKDAKRVAGPVEWVDPRDGPFLIPAFPVPMATVNTTSSKSRAKKKLPASGTKKNPLPWVFYGAFLDAVAARLRMHHALGSDDVSVDGPLARRAREVAMKMLVVGFFPKAPAAFVRDAQRIVGSARNLGYGVEPWMEDLKNVMTIEIARTPRDEKGMLQDTESLVRRILDGLGRASPDLHEKLRAPEAGAIREAARVLARIRVVFPYEKEPRRPGRTTVGIHGAMKRFAEALGMTGVPAFERDGKRERKRRG